MVILETDRLLLRYMLPEDVPFLVALWMDPEVTRFMGGPRDLEILTIELEEKSGNPCSKPFDLWILVEKTTGQMIGQSGLLQRDVEYGTEYELIYVLANKSWGKGYATEIARGLIKYAYYVRNLNRVISLIEPENKASEKVARKMGMKLEKEIKRPGGGVRRVYAMHIPQ
jgi:RimJ/RimL family protein N-acetyltransferase